MEELKDVLKELIDLECRLNFFSAFKDTYKDIFYDADRNTYNAKLNIILLPLKGDPKATLLILYFQNRLMAAF